MHNRWVDERTNRDSTPEAKTNYYNFEYNYRSVLYNKYIYIWKKKNNITLYYHFELKKKKNGYNLIVYI